MNVTDGERIHFAAEPDKPVKPRTRKRWWLATVVVVVVVLYIVNWFSDVSNVSMDVSPDGLVVFSARGKGGNDLYIFDLKTKTVKPFVISPEYEDSPKFSPDGKSVAYSMSRKPLSAGHIYVRSLDGRHVTQLTNENNLSDSQPAFSPDGSTIAFIRANRLRDYSMGGKVWDQKDLCKVDVSGGKSVKLLELRHHYSAGDPCFAPDGTSIMYTANEVENTTIMVLRAPFDGHNPEKLVLGHEPSSLRGGKQIVFISDRTTEYQYEVWMMNSDGTGQKQITHTKPSTLLVSVANGDPAFSNDGKSVCYLHSPGWDEAEELWEVGVDGRNPKLVADSGLFKHPLRWKH